MNQIGGFIYALESGEIDINNNNFKNSKVNMHGGGVFINKAA